MNIVFNGLKQRTNKIINTIVISSFKFTTTNGINNSVEIMDAKNHLELYDIFSTANECVIDLNIMVNNKRF